MRSFNPGKLRWIFVAVSILVIAVVWPRSTPMPITVDMVTGTAQPDIRKLAGRPFDEGNWHIEGNYDVTLRVSTTCSLQIRAAAIYAEFSGDKLGILDIHTPNLVREEAATLMKSQIVAAHLAHSGSQQTAMNDVDAWAKSDERPEISQVSGGGLQGTTHVFIESHYSFNDAKPFFLSLEAAAGDGSADAGPK